MATTYLDDIVAYHRRRAAAEPRDLHALARAALAASASNEPGSFAGAIRAACDRGDRPAVIAEIKRATPSKGRLASPFDAGALAARYCDGGAAALSVLTDEVHFDGSADDLRQAKAASGLPTLRKDFTVCVADVYDACLMGADAVLLIAAVLADHELLRFGQVAHELGLDVVVEAHDDAEIERAAAAGATLVGVNQRDLVTFEVDTERACAVVGSIPQGVIKVAESGIADAADAATLAVAGYDAVLVGEMLVRAQDPAAELRSLRGVPRS